jgi:DNA-binding IclR family transcriptional regulator
MTATVRSAMRALDLIELLSGETRGTSLSEAAARFAMPKSSTLMLLRTLVARGYVRRTDNDRYFLSEEFRAGAFGWLGVPYANLAALAQPVMQAMSRELGESMTFGVVASPGYARLLSKVTAEVEIRWDSDIARPLPMYCTAVGRALLSAMPELERAGHLKAVPLKAVTPNTVTDPARLKALLKKAGPKGHVVVMEEFALGGTGVAAPVLDENRRPVAALNVSCITGRFHGKREKVIASVIAGAATISGGLPKVVAA